MIAAKKEGESPPANGARVLVFLVCPQVRPSQRNSLIVNYSHKKESNGEDDSSEVRCEKSREAAKGKSKSAFGIRGCRRNGTSRSCRRLSRCRRALSRSSSPPIRVPSASGHTFAKIPDVLDMPDLIELQKASFEWFISEGLMDAFDSISPIKDFTGNLVLEFGEHSLGEPKYSVEECRERDMTYSAPLRVRVRLITAESGEIKGIPDQEIFMGDFPLMTDKGTFMINGAERVIVSQLVRSPGVYF